MSSSQSQNADGRATLWATLVALTMIAQQVAGKATRDAFFLSWFPAQDLALLMTVGAGLSIVVVLVFTRMLTAFSPRRAAPAMFLFHAALLTVEWWLAETQPKASAAMLYAHVTALGATVVSGFWSVVNERFDPHTARQRIARIGSGATVGGLVGGLLAWQGNDMLGVRGMLLSLAVLNVLCAVGVGLIGAPAKQAEKEGDEPGPSGLAVFGSQPYLRNLALLVFLIAVADAAVDFAFKTRVDRHLDQGPDSAAAMATFFAIFYSATGLLTLLLQTTLTSRMLERSGLSATISTWPAAFAAGGLLSLLAPRLWSAVLTRGAVAIIESSLFRSAYELLYTPLSPAQKRPTKALIDVGAIRLGTALGGGIAMAGVALLGESSAERLLLAIAVACGVGALVVVGMLHQGYVTALADSLRSGAVELEREKVQDATTLHTLTQSSVAFGRQELLAQIEALRQEGKRDGDSSLRLPEATLGPAPSADFIERDRALECITDLMSSDAHRVRRWLPESAGMPRAALPHLIPLLARRELADEVVDVLARYGAKVVGLIVDALLDPDTELITRRRLPRVLARCPDPRCTEGLIQGLADSDFRVRARCAVALARLLQSDPELRPRRRRVFEAVIQEARSGVLGETRRSIDESGDEESPPFADARSRRRVGRGLEHIFTLLSIALEPEPLRLSFRALASEDQALRGTALEYLENVLPEGVRNELWPYLSDREVTTAVRRSSRSAAALVSDLQKTLGG